MYLNTMSMEKIKELYIEHEEKDFYIPNCEFVSSGPAVAMILVGPNVVNRVRNTIGSINTPNTIRYAKYIIINNKLL